MEKTGIVGVLTVENLLTTERSMKMKKLMMMLTLAAMMVVVSSGAQVASGVDYNKWDNTGSGNWDTGSNWSFGHEPLLAEGADIENGGTATINTIGNSAYRLFIKAGSTCNIDSGGELLLGLSGLSLGHVTAGTLNVQGLLTWDGSHNQYWYVGMYGGAPSVMNISGSGSVIAPKMRTNITSGTDSRYKDTSANISVTDSGNFTVIQFLHVGYQNGTANLSVAGSATLGVGTNLLLGHSGFYGTQSLTVTGGGSTIGIGGNMEVSSTATLNFEIDASEITSVDIVGDLKLLSSSSSNDIMVDVTALAGCNMNKMYTIMTWDGAYDTSSANGAELMLTQASVDAGWSMTVDEVNKRVTVIPEPATLCLLGLGGIGILVRRRARS